MEFVTTAVCGCFASAPTPPPQLDATPTFGRTIAGRYDAASDSPSTRNIWASADNYDADASNSLGVRKRLRERSRYEQGNNGYSDGMVSTHANYTVGRGPKLRMETGSDPFNRMVEAKWIAWCKATGFARKLRTMQRAKTGDGEGIGILRSNPRIADPVKIDLQLIECDQMTTPFLPWGVPGKIDGLEFDEFGNVVDYQILKYHPGGLIWNPILNPDNYPEKFVCHLYDRKRPGQHRGVPAMSSTLNVGAIARRFRESYVGKAEKAAMITAVLEMPVVAESPHQARPFSTVPIDKDTMIASPAGAKLSQLKHEGFDGDYDPFIRSQVGEQSRPLSMGPGMADCDFSAFSYSGGQLNQLSYFVGVDVEEQDVEEDVLDKVFDLWFAEAVWVYGWNVDAEPSPKHSWRWPARPKIDEEKTSNARSNALRTGQTTLSRIYEEDGYEFEEEIIVMAKDYGVTVDEMRKILRNAIFENKQASTPSVDPSQNQKVPVNGKNGFGGSRIPALAS